MIARRQIEPTKSGYLNHHLSCSSQTGLFVGNHITPGRWHPPFILTVLS